MNESIHTVKNGEVVIPIDIKHNDKRIIVSWEIYTGGKTISQLGYYFAAVVEGAIKNCESFGGWSKEDLHDWLKVECNKKQLLNPKTGEIAFVPSTTATLKKYEYAEFIDRCIKRLAEEGYVVPEPEAYFRQLEDSKIIDAEKSNAFDIDRGDYKR